MNPPETFAEDLKGRYEACRKQGQANYTAAYSLLIVAVLCSALATISIATDLWSKTANAILAAIPGIVFLANKQFRFEERSRWWFRKYYVIEGLHRGLTREGRDEADVSKELTAAAREHAEHWPGFGESPKT